MKPKIDHYFRQLKLFDTDGKLYQHNIFDYEKIWNSDVPIYLIISERGAKAKSTEAKRLARLIYKNENLKTMWVMNSAKTIDKEKKSHLTKPFRYLRDTFTLEENSKSDYIYANKDVNSWYTKFAPISTAENEKGSRDDYGLMIYEEFNVIPNNFKNNQIDMFSSLIGTLSDPINIVDDKFKKLIIHGNNKTLSNELLVRLGVVSIKKEVTDIYVGEFLLMRILCPIMDDNEKNRIRDLNKDNWKFKLQEQLGKVDHTYFNENLYDVINNVNKWMITLDVIEQYYIKVKNGYFVLSIIKSADLGNVIYFYDVDKKDIEKDAVVFCINKRDVLESISLNTNLKKQLFLQLADNKLYFKELYIRDYIIESIIK